MNNSSDLPPSLYIHFPWCVKKCPYCDFNSHEGEGELPEQAYIDVLIDDLSLNLGPGPEFGAEANRKLTSIFMGGGTPSLFSPASMTRLLTAVSRRFDIGSIEITMEANPGVFDQSHFDGYRNAGINRLSIGAQSFSNDSLKSLGRIHRSEETERAFAGARQAGFRRINLDLMHGLPDQSVESALTDLDRAIALGPEHISWYQLTLEPNTYFYRHPPTLPTEDTLAEIQDRGEVRLREAGYMQYEVSAYCQPGEEARHNLNYWEFGDYIGIGAGAHGKHTRNSLVTRTRKSRLPRDYMANPGARVTEVPAAELPLEYLMNVLRLNRGFTLRQFEDRTGLAASTLDDFLRQASDKSLVVVEGQKVRPTATGRRFLNDLLLIFQPTG